MTFTVIGHFDCGCGHAAQPEPLEVVYCSSTEETEAVAARMRIHSGGHQCWATPAMAIVVSSDQAQVVFGEEGKWEGHLLFMTPLHTSRRTEFALPDIRQTRRVEEIAQSSRKRD